MNSFKYVSCFIITLALQLVLTKYCQIGSYIMISLLPALVLSLPTYHSTSLNMIIAFACGLCVDFLSDGIWGMNAAALTVTAAAQKSAIKVFIGEDIVERGYSISFWANGFVKINGATMLVVLIYMISYTLLDCAGVRDLVFILKRVLYSSLFSLIFCLFTVNILCPRPQR